MQGCPQYQANHAELPHDLKGHLVEKTLPQLADRVLVDVTFTAGSSGSGGSSSGWRQVLSKILTRDTQQFTCDGEM